MDDNTLFLVVIVAAVIVCAAAGICVVLVANRTREQDPNTEAIAKAILDGTRELSRESSYYVQVNAVLALTESFTDNPDMLENLAAYSRKTVAAALLFRVNSLGESIQHTQELLTKTEVSYASYGGSDRANNINSLREQRDRLLAEQAAANQAVEQFIGVPA